MHIATRHYDDWYPATLEPFHLEDRLYRKAKNKFLLLIAGELPGDPPVEKWLNLPGAYEWYQDCPEQIERVVIIGGLQDEPDCLRCA